MLTNYTFHKWSERGLSVFKYLLAGYMMLAGVLTPFSGVEGTKLGFFYSNHISLTILGLIIFVSGAMLMYGKIRKSKRWTGKGLLWIYLCFLFATLANFIAFSADPTYWVANLIFTIVTALLWLRWKNKTEYIDPRHFIRDIEKLTA
jgi:Mn2+/Fe2+ NRAMP family transporter